jgi:hypothetical protein
MAPRACAREGRAHLDLGEEREGRAEAGRALLDLRGVARLLPAIIRSNL